MHAQRFRQTGRRRCCPQQTVAVAQGQASGPRGWDQWQTTAALLLRAALLWVPALSGCGDSPERSGPQPVYVFGFEPDTKTYSMRRERLETLESARRIKGAAAEMRGGGSLLVEQVLVEALAQDISELSLVQGDAPVRADYTIRDGAIVPRDWETLVMFSFYRHLETARSFFADLGADANVLRPLQAHFDMRLTSLFVQGTPLITDNAGYTPIADAFWLFPGYGSTSGVPLPLNRGVVTHELSHAVKHRALHAAGEIPDYVDEEWPNRAANAYRADDEGLADFFAAVFTGDPNYIQVSFAEVTSRNVAQDRQFTQALYEALSQEQVTFNPYLLGSAFAAWLWDIGADAAERRQVAEVVLTVLQDFKSQLGSDYELTQLLDAIAAALPTPLADRACALLDQRLEGAFRGGDTPDEQKVPTCGI